MEDRCISCGNIIPEGRQICPVCDKVSREVLSIDEIIGHCKRQVQRFEDWYGRGYFETASLELTATKEYWEHKQVAQYLEELKRYREAEELGFIFKLPCKTGDTVFLIDHSAALTRRKPLKCYVDEFTITGRECYAVLNGISPFYALPRFKAVNIKQFGVTVFLTEDEAVLELQKAGGIDCGATN